MSDRATVIAVAISFAATRRPGSTTATSRGISATVVVDIELVRTEIDLDRALRANGQAVADIPYVDAAVYRCGARIQKRDFQVAVFRHRLAERNAHNAAGALAVQNDRGDRTIVDLNFEIAPRLMRAQIVEHQYQIADRDVAALRQRHEEFAMSPRLAKRSPLTKPISASVTSASGLLDRGAGAGIAGAAITELTGGAAACPWRGSGSSKRPCASAWVDTQSAIVKLQTTKKRISPTP